MTYIQGFVAAVPAVNKDKYTEYAQRSTPLFKEFGVMRLVEAWGDDVPDGKVTDCKRAVKAATDECVVFSFVEWPDKATRDEGWQRVMNDPRMQPNANEMPFDGQRMVWGGFRPLLDE